MIWHLDLWNRADWLREVVPCRSWRVSPRRLCCTTGHAALSASSLCPFLPHQSNLGLIQVILLFSPDLHTDAFHLAEQYGAHAMQAVHALFNSLLSNFQPPQQLDVVILKIALLPLMLSMDLLQVIVDLKVPIVGGLVELLELVIELNIFRS